ncbi:MAG TPA: prepilin-type N-terminal cleavage/methylation domain-containing protein [Dissulfurispiraceae bacterium]|nr:prepilin-type N-terminal cleavage/methylation domain-containing protein [Dissulfurispiraceae bacterium]
MDRVAGNQRGFTLVELAIVLVIIGIMLGAVLKGQELINGAKNKRLYNTFREVSAGVYTYYDKYNRYPGDDNLATTRGWTAGATAIANGNADGQIAGMTACAAGAATETCQAWYHMRLAGILTGSDTTSPSHPYGGEVAVGMTNWVIGGWQKIGVCFQNLPNSAARWLDETYDDGVWNTGSIRGNGNYIGNSPDVISAGWVCIAL